MTRLSRYFLLAVTLACSLMWSINAAGATCSKPLLIAGPEIKPFYYQDERGQFVGLDVELIDHIFKFAGCRYELKNVTWKRLLQAIRYGTVDMAFNASLTPERQKFARFTIPYRRETMVMFMRRSDIAAFEPLSLADVVASKYNIGVTLGSWYGEDYAHLYARNGEFQRRLLKTAQAPQLFHWLEAGRIDIALNDLINGLYVLRERGTLGDIAVHPMIVNDDYVHFMASRLTVSEDDVKAVNTAISSLQRSTTYAELLRKYVSEEYMQYLPMQ